MTAAGDLVQSREEEDGVMLGGSDEEGIKTPRIIVESHYACRAVPSYCSPVFLPGGNTLLVLLNACDCRRICQSISNKG